MLIAIAGPMGSGKSAIAERLRERYGFSVVTFADGLREELLARLPRTLTAMHDAEPHESCRCSYVNRSPSEQRTACIRRMLYETKPPTFRALLQEYGSDVRRADDPDYWVKRWAEKVSGLTRSGGFICGARRQGTAGGNDPADCGWPSCGCDPEAHVEPGTISDPEAYISAIASGSIRPLGSCHVVAPDCRFPNEARTVRAMGGLLWRVERPGYVGSGHVSETALAHWQDWDAEIRNAGTLAELHAEVDRHVHTAADAQADGAA